MIQCPECRQMIPDDSAFCDQCGKELKWCPECRRPKRGTECPVCGTDLMTGRKYLTMITGGGAPVQPQTEPQPQTTEPIQPVAQPQPQATYASSVAPQPQATAVSTPLPTALVGNGWRLPLKDGGFGRAGGIWSELAMCQYVSGSHGSIARTEAGWTICDSGSTNGTFVNGVRLNTGQPVVLNKGNNVKIATVEFIVE